MTEAAKVKPMLKVIESQDGQFELTGLEKRDEARVLEAETRIKMRLRRSAEDIIEIGRDLIAVKEILPHGQFLPWLDAKFGMTDRTARNFMRVAERYAGKSETISDLQPTALYALASAEPEVREEIERMIEAGEVVTKATVARLRAEMEAAQRGRELADLDAEAAEKKAAELEASQSEEAAKIAKRVGDGFEAELRRLRKENEELRRAAAARPEPTTAATNVVALHKPLTDKEKDEIDRTHDDWEGADFDQTASMDSHVRAFLGGLDTLGTTKASAADIIKYFTKSSKAAKQMTREAIAKVFPILQKVKDSIDG